MIVLDYGISNINNLNFKNISQKLAEDNYASEFYKTLIESINTFNSSLDDTKQVGMNLVSFGQNTTFAITALGYTNPSLIRFYGVLENGNSIELVQHVSQISFCLMAVDKVVPDQPKLEIGFRKD